MSALPAGNNSSHLDMASVVFIMGSSLLQKAANAADVRRAQGELAELAPVLAMAKLTATTSTATLPRNLPSKPSQASERAIVSHI